MEFSNQYLTYEEYRGLGGSAIDLMSFNLLEFECRKIIDLRTKLRLKNVDTVPDEVKLCMFKMMEKIIVYDEKEKSINTNNIASENIDGYSVSFLGSNEIEEIIKNKSKELDDIIFESLYGVIVNNEHLIYLG